MIAVLGGYGVGLTMRVPRVPEAGETISGGVLSSGHGGKGSNQAVAIRRLGHPVTLLTAIGDDAAADAALAFWGRENIDTSAVVRLSEPTMTGFILVEPNGENRITLADGALAAITPGALDPKQIQTADMLVISLEIPVSIARAAAQIARDAAVPVLINPAPASSDKNLLVLADVLTPNLSELTQIVDAPHASVKECLDLLREWYSGKVVVTLGSAGALIDENGTRTRIPAVQPEHVIDTTGAGDAFTASLAVTLCEGATLPRAVRFAAAAAACTVSVAEVIPALPRRAEVEKLLASLDPIQEEK